jgi:hypothetical protein
MLGAQLAEVGAHQPGESSVLEEQFVGELQGVVAPIAGAQDDREQLGHGERLGAEVLQALARALMAGQVAHRRVVVQPGVLVGIGVGFAGEHRWFSSFTVCLVSLHYSERERVKVEMWPLSTSRANTRKCCFRPFSFFFPK